MCLANHRLYLSCSPSLKSQLIKQQLRRVRGRSWIRTQDCCVRSITNTTGAVQLPASLFRDNGNVATYLKIQHSLKATSFSLWRKLSALRHIWDQTKLFSRSQKSETKLENDFFCSAQKTEYFWSFKRKHFWIETWALSIEKNDFTFQSISWDQEGRSWIGRCFRSWGQFQKLLVMDVIAGLSVSRGNKSGVAQLLIYLLLLSFCNNGRHHWSKAQVTLPLFITGTVVKMSVIGLWSSSIPV